MAEYVNIKKEKKLYKLSNEVGYFAFLYKSDMKEFGIDIPKLNDDVPDYELSVSLEDDVIERIVRLSVSRIFDKGADYLSISEQCAYDLRFKLLKKGYPDSAISQALALLKEYGYLNDSRFAESYTRSYMNTKSRDAIVRELSHKSLELDDIYGIVDQVYEDYDFDEDEAISSLIEKKFRGQNLSDERIKRRAINLLLRHGFSFDKINKHLT